MRPGPYKGRSSVYSNAGPDCYNLAATTLTVPKGLCTETCVLVWKDGKKQYASCKDRVTCFLRDYTSRQVQAAQAGIPRKLSAAISRECSFVSKSPHLPLDQFQHMFILSASDVEHHGSWDAASACTAGQRLDVAGALVGPKAVVAGTAAESVGCESINVTSHLKDICAEAIKNPTERCIIEPSVYSNIISKFSCNVKETPYLALYVTCIDVKVDDDVGCKVVTPASSQPDPEGGCTCPSGTVQCSLDESRLYGDVMSGIAYGYTVHTKHNRGFKNGNVTAFQTPFCSGATVKVACKNAPDSASKKGEPATTAWLDRGPNCYKPTDSDNRQMCKFACLKLWNPADGALVNVNTPFDDFKDRIKSGRLTVMELTADGNAAIRSCDWAKRIRFAPAEQYEYETWTTSEALTNFCPNSGTLQIVRAFLGCSYSLVDGNESQNCNYVDITKEVTKKCGSAWRSSNKGCTLGADELVAEADACETSCEGEWGIHLYYNCTPETPSASCSLHQATTGLDETENEYACGCPYLAEMCDLEQAETSTVWKDTVRGYTVAILKGNLTYGLNGGYKRYHTTTVSSDTCESTGSRVLCKPPPASIELSPPNQTPDCTTSFSTKTGASSSDDGLCVNECIIATQGECSKATNAWLCVVKKVSNCFIPNKAKSTCFIETEVGNYQAEFQSCSCPEASMPCTEEEVEATRYEWEPTFAPDNAYIVVAPNKVLGPTKTIQPDYGMAAEPGCGSSRYKRVFCRGTSGNTSVTRYDATADCENARSLDASVISDFECRYGCSTRIKKCKAIMTQNPDVHESEYACYTAQLNTIPKLRQCLVESKLVDPETGVGSMEAGFIVVTQEWTSVAFKKEIENPVVVTSLPATTNAVPVIQVKGVNSTGFKIRMKNDFCSVGFASPYTSVGWLASSQGTFLVSGAKSYVRVGTTLASLNQPTTIRHLPRMNSAAPLVFLQHEDSEGGSGNYIVASTVTASSASEATFKLTLVGSGQPSEPIVIGYMIFDEIRQEYCSLGCQLNGISMQTDYADSNERWTAESTDNVILAGQTVVYGSVVDPDGTSPVFVSKHDVAWSSGNEIRSEGGVILDWRYAVPGGKDEHARSHPSGAQTSDSKTSKNDIGESLMQVSENLSVPGARSGWYPAIDIIYNSKCTVGSVSRTNIFPAAGGRKNSVSRRLVALLYVSSGES
ncbi:hypothetical protein TGMAS_218340 [Toxoplasma gondii MAS]|uniref:Microneme protein MIC15 n=1 Tax=Toxoplasma gondii MAS TaxID=943118 RepID=A0A086QT86_TOXGO|nr:hypothetical protein TGMAS_218340 [Toxoplasma gondii MAS]